MRPMRFFLALTTDSRSGLSVTTAMDCPFRVSEGSMIPS